MGKVIMSGIVPQLVAPSTGILASDIAVGSSVYLIENGAAVEYLVVNQGKPSSLYDSSCDGLWLLRKDSYENRTWTSYAPAYNGVYSPNNYEVSTIHSYLNESFFGLFDLGVQSAIKQVKIPYVNGLGTSGSVASGTNGLSTKVFLLGCQEVGFSGYPNARPVDGAKLSYFIDGDGTDACTRRLAQISGVNRHWWLRAPTLISDTAALCVTNTGTCGNSEGHSSSYGIRPAMILPFNAVFDEKTLILKGVA